ncbi:unnamed protein product [Trifolium pratense]|uniref:Uncharacterized protein n=1 Tax=Trifolium pratense TaxID=57577 RepID=A0ACB0LFG9_TRIPR|nr:unnamed protein product [Trifolium pratense]
MAEVIIRGFLLVLDWFLAYTHGYRVSRIVARSEKHNMYMLLDVNTEIYPLNIGERFLLTLSPSLVLNTKDMNSNNVCSRVDCWAGTRPIPPPRLYKPHIITYEVEKIEFWKELKNKVVFGKVGGKYEKSVFGTGLHLNGKFSLLVTPNSARFVAMES